MQCNVDSDIDDIDSDDDDDDDSDDDEYVDHKNDGSDKSDNDDNDNTLEGDGDYGRVYATDNDDDANDGDDSDVDDGVDEDGTNDGDNTGEKKTRGRGSNDAKDGHRQMPIDDHDLAAVDECDIDFCRHVRRPLRRLKRTADVVGRRRDIRPAKRRRLYGPLV
ncbi:hypothetical protein TW95_gp1584 [Pandoravirus inopinatum]|uniref:Uncharacterized protein n=1 Tax=Pandoravirus inopinatum TaxID=1605721 RepID=A0A0B5IZI7_9VIRU|nr:hypothetical protein TW95_gp1584 [Pandoravirus inopinatum]AJF98318.1 hypothetical protein [Pandoravirus inopinatum]